VICFTEVRFLQTYSPLRWSQRPGLFQPFPSLKRSLRPSEPFYSNGTLSPLQGPPELGVSCFDYKWVEHKKEGRRKAIQAQELKWTQMSLSLVTNFFGVIQTWERIWSLWLCLWMKSIALVWGLMAENLDSLKCGWLGVFIAPTTKVTVGEGFCRMAHRTVRCATGHCPVRQPCHTVVGFWLLELLTGGPPNSPVVHQTVTIHCPVRLLALLWLLRAQTRTVHFYCSVADDHWRCVAVTTLAHQTVRCYTGQSGEL
jgi:hypothetical protein